MAKRVSLTLKIDDLIRRIDSLEHKVGVRASQLADMTRERDRWRAQALGVYEALCLERQRYNDIRALNFTPDAIDELIAKKKELDRRRRDRESKRAHLDFLKWRRKMERRYNLDATSPKRDAREV